MLLLADSADRIKRACLPECSARMGRPLSAIARRDSLGSVRHLSGTM
jgi:hypothetical protein